MISRSSSLVGAALRPMRAANGTCNRSPLPVLSRAISVPAAVVTFPSVRNMWWCGAPTEPWATRPILPLAATGTTTVGEFEEHNDV